MTSPIPHWHRCGACEFTWRCEQPGCDRDGTCTDCDAAQRAAWLETVAQARLRWDEDAPETAQEQEQ